MVTKKETIASIIILIFLSMTFSFILLKSCGERIIPKKIPKFSIEKMLWIEEQISLNNGCENLN